MADIKIYPYLSPRIIEVLAPDTSISIQELVNLVRDWEDEDDNMSFDYIISAAGKEDLGSGVTVGITATLNNAQVMFSARSTPIDNGVGRTCDATDIEGFDLYVDDADFITDGVIRGDIVYNMTTGAMATVIEVVDQYNISHLQLSGGSSVEWNSGDSYVIYHNAQCNINGGNLVAKDDSNVTISSVLQSPNVQVVRTSSSSATLQELEALYFSLFEGGVTVDIDNLTGYARAGTDLITGTRQHPSNNMTDASTIAHSNGLNRYYIIGDIDLNDPTIDLQGHTFIGESDGKSLFTIGDGADVLRTEFEEATVQGILDGESVIKNCTILDLNYVNGKILNSIFNGTIELGGGVVAYMFGCKSGIPGSDTPTIDMGGSGQSLALRDYHGGIKLINKTGEDKVSIDFSSGQLKLSDTVTAGTIIVRGVGDITENLSKGAIVMDAVVDMSGLVKPSGGMPRINTSN